MNKVTPLLAVRIVLFIVSTNTKYLSRILLNSYNIGKGFAFVPKHGSNSYSRESAAALRNLGAGVAEEEEEEAQNG